MKLIRRATNYFDKLSPEPNSVSIKQAVVDEVFIDKSEVIKLQENLQL